MKRFTETTKWRDPWFRRLSQTAKLLWSWLTDNCDNAGVIDLDLESASFDIGKPVNADHLTEIESRLHALPNGKVWIPSFIEFQYGTRLSDKCVPHLRVLELLVKHGIQYPDDCNKSTTLLPTLVDTHKTRQEEDKEEDKVSNSGVGGESKPSKSSLLKAKLCAWFGRRLTTAWSDKEERALNSVLALNTPEDDFAALESYYCSKQPYLRRDIVTLLNNWNGEIDRAKGWKNGKSNQVSRPNHRNDGIVKGPTVYGIRKPRLQRELEEAARLAGQVAEDAATPPPVEGGDGSSLRPLL